MMFQLFDTAFPEGESSYAAQAGAHARLIIAGRLRLRSSASCPIQIRGGITPHRSEKWSDAEARTMARQRVRRVPAGPEQRTLRIAQPGAESAGWKDCRRPLRQRSGRLGG